MEIKHTLLNNPWVQEKIKVEAVKYVEWVVTKIQHKKLMKIQLKWLLEGPGGRRNGGMLVKGYKVAVI